MKNGMRESRSSFRKGPRLGDVVINAENVAKGYGDNLLYENMNFNLPPGGIIGVIRTERRR